MKRTVFLVSDRTGITVESLVHALLSQFDGIEFKTVTLPFVDKLEKIHAATQQINAAAEADGLPPLIFSSLVNNEYRTALRESRGELLDLFEAFIGPMENVLGVESLHEEGRGHGIADFNHYDEWVEAVNFALNHDDGVRLQHLDAADIILLGVSRSGKTPTCLYLGLHYGVRAANYPLTEEDIEEGGLPKSLEPYRHKLFGLTIAADRLHRIREQRRPASTYASLDECRKEVQWAEELYYMQRIPYLSTTAMSIEEISAAIVHQAGLNRKAI